MRLDYFLPGEKLLLLGEGNFSFALSLFKLNLNIDITATCYESSIVSENCLNNIDRLKEFGVRTMLGIDATKLEDNIDIVESNFDHVIFNFPHSGGKMRIERNRKLLKEFFLSVSKILNQSSTVFVTLCDGQGGTPLDERKRRPDDTWRIDEMAANGNFLLTNVEKFLFHNFQYYNCVGYRSLDKDFFNDGALVHVFKKSLTILNDDYFNIDMKKNFNNDSLIEYYEGINFKRDRFLWEDIIDIVKSLDSTEKTKEKNFNNQPVALFPKKFTLHVTFQITDDDYCFNEFYFLSEIYLLANDIVDNVKFLYDYSIPDSNKKKLTYEIVYKSYNIPLYRKRVIDIHNNFIIKIIEERFNFKVSK